MSTSELFFSIGKTSNQTAYANPHETVTDLEDLNIRGPKNLAVGDMYSLDFSQTRSFYDDDLEAYTRGSQHAESEV